MGLGITTILGSISRDGDTMPSYRDQPESTVVQIRDLDALVRDWKTAQESIEAIDADAIESKQALVDYLEEQQEKRQKHEQAATVARSAIITAIASWGIAGWNIDALQSLVDNATTPESETPPPIPREETPE